MRGEICPRFPSLVLSLGREKSETKNLFVWDNTESSNKGPPNPPTFVYKNANQIIEYQYLSRGFIFPSLCFLSLSIILDKKVKIPDHCIQATKDAIDRELDNGLKLQTSIEEEIIINPTSNKEEVEKYHIVSLSNIIIRKTKL